MKDEIKLVPIDNDCFDKKQIALAIRNSNFDDELSCSLLDEGIIVSCSHCSLEKICNGIDLVVEEHKKRSRKVVKSFNLN